MTSRDRRALLFGAIIALPALFVPFVLKPYLRVLSTYHEEIADEQDRLAREQRSIADLPTFRTTRRTASHQLEHEVNRLFQANNDLAATTDLAQYIEGIAKTTGVQLQQTETRPAYPVLQNLQALQLAVRANGSQNAILQFLHQLETGNKLVRIGNLTIDAGHETPNPNGEQGGEILSVSANVYGYRLSGADWQSVATRSDGIPSPFTRVASASPPLDAGLNRNLFNVAHTQPLSYQRAIIPTTVQPAPQKRQPPFHLIGTVTSAHDANFAVLQKSGGATPPQVVSVGERIGDYILSALRRSVAVLTARDGTRLELQADRLGLSSESATSKNSAEINIEKDSTGNLRVKHSGSGSRGTIGFTGPAADTVYAQVDGPTGWGGDASRFLLSTDGKGNCCKQISMTIPGEYVYHVWDKGENVIGEGTVVLDPPEQP